MLYPSNSARYRLTVAEAAYSARRLTAASERQQGIWETSDGSIAVVGSDAICLWNGQTLQLAKSPIVADAFYDTTSATWKIDDSQLKQDLEQFDRAKCADVFRRLCDYLGRWIWVADVNRFVRLELHKPTEGGSPAQAPEQS